MIEELPGTVREKLRSVKELTKANTGLILNLALNYGSRREMVRAVRAISSDAKDGRIGLDGIDEEMLSSYLDTKGLSDPDILIRTSGEKRLSNFLLWQLSYAELFFLDKHWPDFRKEDISGVIGEYLGRERRYGG